VVDPTLSLKINRSFKTDPCSRRAEAGQLGGIAQAHGESSLQWTFTHEIVAKTGQRG
jgi:hypothetical protein